MEKLLLIALIGTSVCILLRSVKPEFTLPAVIVTGALLLLPVLMDAVGITETLQSLADRFSIPDAYGRALLKMTVIAYATSFGANLCRDQGLSSLASKLELGGRVAILGCALPAAVALLETGLSLLGGSA